MDSMNDLRIVATAARIKNWLDAHDQAVSSCGRRTCLKYLTQELRNLQSLFPPPSSTETKQ